MAKRTAMLHRAQQIVHERSDIRADLAAGLPQRRRQARRRIGLGLIKGHAYSAPYEDVTIKKTDLTQGGPP